MNLSGSYYLTEKFEPVASTNLTQGSYEFSDEASYRIVAGKITKDITTFAEVTKLVIGNLEGGYFNPQYHGTGDSRYSTSGETMFGIDRKQGGTINTSAAGVQFWNKIGEAQKTKKWRWNYIPPDPLQTELLNLAVQMMEPMYNSYIKQYLLTLKNGQQVLDLINKDGRLKFNFVYATWNGPGWFQGFANRVVTAYNSGKKTSDDLLKVFISARINSVGILGKGPSRGSGAWSLINQGGQKIAGLVGVAV
jgi:hypothetical protein